MDATKELLKQYTMASTPELSLNCMKTWARLLSVYDGDTITLAIPCYAGVFKFNVRVNGIDTPEMKGTHKIQAYAARNRLCQILGMTISLENMESSKQLQAILEKEPVYTWILCGDYDKYGRLLCDVYTAPDSQKSVSEQLISEGHAYAYDGGTKLL